MERALLPFRQLRLASGSDLAFLRSRFTVVPIIAVFDTSGRERGTLEGELRVEEILSLLSRGAGADPGR